MTFPQTDPDKYVTGGQQFWRLNTPLQSPGDMYESTQGAMAFAIGPDSDIARVLVTYLDEQRPQSLVNQFIVSPDKAFVGRVDARNEIPYPLTSPGPNLPGRAGRILLSSADIYDPAYLPLASTTDDTISFEIPLLDVIQYFGVPSTVVSPRTDKVFQYQYYDAISGVQFLVIPYYGRKYAFVDFTNWNSTDANTLEIVGVNFSLTDEPDQRHQETILLAPTVVAAAGGRASKVVRAATNGMFDALVISVDNAGPAPLKIVMSDDPL